MNSNFFTVSSTTNSTHVGDGTRGSRILCCSRSFREASASKRAISDEHCLGRTRQFKRRFFPELSFSMAYLKGSAGRTVGFPMDGLLNPTYALWPELTRMDELPVDLKNLKEGLSSDDFHETKSRVLQPTLNRLSFSLNAVGIFSHFFVVTIGPNMNWWNDFTCFKDLAGQ